MLEDAVKGMIAEVPAELIVNGKPLTGYAGTITFLPGGDNEAAERQVDVGWLGNAPNESEPIGYNDESWTVSQFQQFGDAITATLTSNG